VNVTLSPAGCRALVKPGDFILTRGSGWVSRAIQVGQWLRVPRRWCWCNHAAGVIDGDGTIVEMLARGATVNHLSKYDEKDYMVVSPDLDDARRAEAVDYWSWLAVNKTGYGWWSIGADVVALLLHLKFGAAMAGRPVCSAAVAAGLGLPEWRACPAAVTPADLAQRFGVTAPLRIHRPPPPYRKNR